MEKILLVKFGQVLWKQFIQIYQTKNLIFLINGLETANICSKTGLLANSNCSSYYEYYIEGTAPTTYCNEHSGGTGKTSTTTTKDNSDVPDTPTETTPSAPTETINSNETPEVQTPKNTTTENAVKPENTTTIQNTTPVQNTTVETATETPSQNSNTSTDDLDTTLPEDDTFEQ